MNLAPRPSAACRWIFHSTVRRSLKLRENMLITFPDHYSSLSLHIPPPSASPVCIVMDCTGSMASWIEAARDTVLEAADKIRAASASAEFRLAFVGYRDHGDQDQIGALHHRHCLGAGPYSRRVGRGR